MVTESIPQRVRVNATLVDVAVVAGGSLGQRLRNGAVVSVTQAELVAANANYTTGLRARDLAAGARAAAGGCIAVRS